MKIFKFLTGAAVVFGATIESNPTQIGTESDDVSIAILAESLDKIKFELNEILASREQERDHLEVNNSFISHWSTWVFKLKLCLLIGSKGSR